MISDKQLFESGYNVIQVRFWFVCFLSLVCSLVFSTVIGETIVRQLTPITATEKDNKVEQSSSILARSFSAKNLKIINSWAFVAFGTVFVLGLNYFLFGHLLNTISLKGFYLIKLGKTHIIIREDMLSGILKTIFGYCTSQDQPDQPDHEIFENPEGQSDENSSEKKKDLPEWDPSAKKGDQPDGDSSKKKGEWDDLIAQGIRLAIMFCVSCLIRKWRQRGGRLRGGPGRGRRGLP